MLNRDLIKKHDVAGPRYTSYPAANHFHNRFSESEYVDSARQSNQSKKPISLYFHLPFCSSICYYCACNKIVTKDRSKVRPYLDRLIKEIEMQAKLFDRERSVTQLHFGGGTPSFFSHAEITELMFYIGKHFNVLPNKESEISIELDPREADEALIALLVGLGFNRISLGVQDFDANVQKAVNRIQPQSLVRTLVDTSREYGIESISMDLIYGLPFQSVASFSTTIDKVIAMSPDRISLFNYAHLPERFKPQRRIAEVDLPSAEQKLKIFETSVSLLEAAGYVYIGMDHFAKPNDELCLAQKNNQLYRNFQGYSTQQGSDLIGLGVSSISSVNNTFSQHSPDLKQYMDSIDNGRLPVWRGFSMNQDDKIRRDVISQLICHFRLKFEDIEKQFGIDFRDYFSRELEALTELSNDGLLTIDDEKIVVNEVGRFLIRRICMEFDVYLQHPSGRSKAEGEEPKSAVKYSRII